MKVIGSYVHCEYRKRVTRDVVSIDQLLMESDI